eukprot:1161664-Pelagomonas_calceolata.AAC.25
MPAQKAQHMACNLFAHQTPTSASMSASASLVTCQRSRLSKCCSRCASRSCACCAFVREVAPCTSLPDGA